MEKFTGNEGGVIKLSDASAMTANYRGSDLDGGTKGHFFGKKVLRELLKQRGCVGIRIYYGLDAEGNQQLILVGAKANMDDMTNLCVDMSSPCPNNCGVANSLNS